MRKLIFPVMLAFCFVCLAESEQFAGKVVGVSDGDTISVMRDGVPAKVRLYAVDCPENGQPWAERAKYATSKMCNSQVVNVEVRDKDKFGRLVGVVTLSNGKVLNSELVREGFAWWYPEYAPGDVKLEQLEAAAREAGIGLWSAPSPVPPWEFRKNPTKPAPVPQQSEAPAIAQPVTESPVVVETPPTPVAPVVQQAPAPQSPAAAASDEVFITNTGEKYHRGSCRYLSKSKIPISREEATQRGYQPCKVCSP